MKTIIAGSRSLSKYSLVEQAINSCPWKDEITEIVSGGARGVDMLGEQWAGMHGYPVKQFYVTSMEWECFGRQAGIIRNGKMARYADALILVWDGESRGSANMLEQAQKKGMKIHLVRVDKGNKLV